MKPSLLLWQTAALTFTAVVGTLLHFLYDWTGAIALAPISAVNESTWEHMKILFFPMLLFALIQYPFFRVEYQNFWCVKLIGIVLGVLLIPILFYTLSGIFGKTPDWLNILIFFVAAASACAIEAFLFKRKAPCLSPVLAIILLCVIAAAFVFFTFSTPKIPIFQDPITKSYGFADR